MKKAKSELLKKIHGGQTCQLISTATKLGIFDCLYGGAKTIEDLARLINIDVDLCSKLVLAMEALHLVESKDDTLFSLTEEGSYLAGSFEDSLKAIAIYKGSRPVWRALEYLHEGMIKNTSPFELAFHENFYSYLEKHDEDFKIFHEAMEMYEEKSSKKILECYDFSAYHSIIDIGGGLGSFLKEILEKAPNAKGTLFDLPKVIDLARSKFTNEERISFIAGSFFEEIPTGFDVYVLRNILHNWDDGKSIDILSKIKRAKVDSAKILIFDTIVENTTEKRLGKFATLNMFAMTSGGKERTIDEFFYLANQSGLQITNIMQTSGSKALIEMS